MQRRYDAKTRDSGLPQANGVAQFDRRHDGLRAGPGVAQSAGWLMAPRPRPQFRVDPLVVYRLGEELITDETQALLELIKNAYDADASYARVTIDTQTKSGEPGGEIGFIEVADDGFGMELDTIIGSWLLIA